MPALPPRQTIVALVLAVAWALWGRVDGVAARAWQRPVAGAVTAGFRFDRARPYARGQRRGIALAATPGTAVRAACDGRVTFAGRLPVARRSPGAAAPGAVARRPLATPGPARATLPPAGWLGLALLALGVPAGGGATVLARRRRAAERAPVRGWAPR